LSDREIKITDKRMFTPDGRLREEYRHLDVEDEERESEESERQPERAEPESTEPRADREAPADRTTDAPPPADLQPPPPESSGGRPPLEIPGTPEGLGRPTFFDLVALLAEPVAIYLGEVELPDGKSAENLDLARLHIDLLELVRDKSVGNLSADESAYLEDLLYRFRLRYVQKRG
jgi:hypothetical protein